MRIILKIIKLAVSLYASLWLVSALAFAVLGSAVFLSLGANFLNGEEQVQISMPEGMTEDIAETILMWVRLFLLGFFPAVLYIIMAIIGFRRMNKWIFRFRFWWYKRRMSAASAAFVLGAVKGTEMWSLVKDQIEEIEK